MRRPLSIVSLAVSLVFVSTSALAQKKPKDENRDDGPSASASWSDPVENEKSDKPQASEADDAPAKPRSKRAPDPGRARDPIQVFGQVVIGFGKAPEESPDFEPGNQGTALGFQLGGRYDVTTTLSAGLRFPITMTMVKQANGDTLNSTVLGSPELFGEYRIPVGRLTTVPILFGVGIPIAAGNPDQTGSDTTGMSQDYANRLADATTGFRDSELFQPKRLPIILGGGVRHERKDWELHADLKLVLLPALGTDVANPSFTTPPGAGTYERNAFAMREVTTLGGTYNFLDSPLLYAGLDFAIVWTPIKTFAFEPSAQGGKPTSVQAVLEPKVGARFGSVAPSLGYIAPLGGRLGAGDIGGVRLHLDVLL